MQPSRLNARPILFYRRRILNSCSFASIAIFLLSFQLDSKIFFLQSLSHILLSKKGLPSFPVSVSHAHLHLFFCVLSISDTSEPSIIIREFILA